MYWQQGNSFPCWITSIKKKKKEKSPRCNTLSSLVSPQLTEMSQAAQPETSWEFRSCKYIKVLSSQRISHANSCRIGCSNITQHLSRFYYRQKSLCWGRWKGLHQQLHGLVVQQHRKLRFSEIIGCFHFLLQFTALGFCRASNEHGKKIIL